MDPCPFIAALLWNTCSSWDLMRIDPLCLAKAALNVMANLALICRHVNS